LYFTCCKIVGVNPGADVETIKTAFRKSAKELHPDVNTSAKAHDYFIILQNAYQYLLDHPYIPPKDPYFNKQANRMSDNFGQSGYVKASFRQTYHIQRYTLREVLKKSFTARLLYVFFHVLFLSIGFFLIIRSAYDVFFISVDKQTDQFSAYISIFFGIFFGIMITSIFLYTGYTFLRDR
jgi:curved DNA-binding protein CbpA